MKPATVLLVLALGLVVTAAGCGAPPELPVYATVETLDLTSSLGDDLSEESLAGKVHVVDFIFTSCGAACPVMTAKMKDFYDDLEGEEGVGFLSVTTDPERDTVEVLHDYAAELGVDQKRWLFGRAPMEEVRRLSEKEFLLAAAGFPIGHSQRFVLVDRERQIRGYYDSRDAEDLARLRRDLNTLLRRS